MRQFFITVAGTIAGIFGFFVLLIVIFMFFGLLGSLGSINQKTPDRVLTMDLRQPFIDHSVGESLFGGNPKSVVDTVYALHRAKDDDSVKGVFIRAENFGMAPASAEELRLALLDFKESGKFVIAHAQGFEGTSPMSYQAVSAADEIWMQDTTGFAVSGMRSETEFLGGVMEKFDADPEFFQFHEYKNAVNSYTEKDFTPAHREATTSYLTSIFDNAVAQIAEDREMSVASITDVLMTSPHSAEDAMAAGMVDKLGQLAEAKDYVRKKTGNDKIAFLSLSDYGPGTTKGESTIAFIGGQGAVLPGQSSGGSLFGGGISMGGDTVSDGFDAALKDKKVKAIVFRVSSPGGSPAASDQILAAADRARDAGKPVVISMGQYAASGGYYVAAHADHIVALPQTITGSIGVFGGKVALEGTFAKVGYNIEGITVGGEFAGAYSADTPFSPSQSEAYRGQLQDIYDDFTQRVANGRDLPLERVQEIAKGRVWTGAQAKEIGLVDELGGIMTAINAAKKLAEIDADEDVRIKIFPRQKTVEEQIEDLFTGSAQVAEDVKILREITALPEVQAALRARNSARFGQEMKADIPELR
ncbi:protease [Litorimonas cladophorae]|uniref:Protease n=1 Tax=Litorimonas cladophorae TaxID=1220491 RepID=A0A918KAC9_9PROT|nr:signal peptide peptidase SppA [Litorimonas cladophorae]GGX55840.1 protease [Litorimonas cladophorae]